MVAGLRACRRARGREECMKRAATEGASWERGCEDGPLAGLAPGAPSCGVGSHRGLWRGAVAGAGLCFLRVSGGGSERVGRCLVL